MWGPPPKDAGDRVEQPDCHKAHVGQHVGGRSLCVSETSRRFRATPIPVCRFEVGGGPRGRFITLECWGVAVTFTFFDGKKKLDLRFVFLE